MDIAKDRQYQKEKDPKVQLCKNQWMIFVKREKVIKSGHFPGLSFSFKHSIWFKYFKNASMYNSPFR